MLLILIALEPLLVRVADFCPPLLLTGTDCHVIDDGRAVTRGPELVPVPESATESGVLLALVMMLREAERAPTATGEKTIDSVQDEEAARVEAHVEDETEKSVALAPAMGAAAPRVTELRVVLLMVMD